MQALQRMVLGVLVALWLGLAVLLLVSRGAPEAFLVAHLHPSHADAFRSFDRTARFTGAVLTASLLLAAAAFRHRRGDVLLVLVLGPLLALPVALACLTPWSDPHWPDFVAVLTIGWLVGLVGAALYWAARWVPA